MELNNDSLSIDLRQFTPEEVQKSSALGCRHYPFKLISVLF